MIPCLHFGLRLASGRFPIEPKLASWVESGYKSPESPGPRQRGRRRDGLSRRRRGRFRSTAPYPAATNSRGVSKPRPRRDNGLTFKIFEACADFLTPDGLGSCRKRRNFGAHRSLVQSCGCGSAALGSLWFDSPRPFSLVDPNWRTYTMATAAQIEANRRNAQRSTVPKTDEGKARVRLNAIKHGMTARTIMPVLPQEDPKELEDRTEQAITAMKPRNPLEHNLVCRAVRLAGELDRAERVGTAHLAHRVRMAARSGPETVSAFELKEVHELGSKLFFQSGIRPGYPESSADDYPAVIVRRLEESAEGCRWLLARWAELRNVLDRKAAWSDPEIIRFLGLQGKRSIEVHFDPELNSLFRAFDALGHRMGHKFWKDRRDMLPVGYKGGFMIVPYREIAPPPSDETAALSLIRSVIERHVGRLEDLLAEHEEIEADEADERYDCAALDCSPAFERHRRYQSARHRELMRTLETLRKMRKEEFGTGNGEAEKADGKCR